MKMLKKNSLKWVASTALLSVVLVGCSADNTDKEKVVADGIDFDTIYQLDDKDVLVKLNGKQLTVGEAKQQAFENYLLPTINSFIDNTLLIEKYNITEEDVQQEITKMKEALGEGASDTTFNEEQIRYDLAYKKATDELVNFTEDDLKTIYDTYYAKIETRSFEDMKDELKAQAPYLLGVNDVHNLQKELREKADIQYNEESLKRELGIVPADLPNKKE